MHQNAADTIKSKTYFYKQVEQPILITKINGNMIVSYYYQNGKMSYVCLFISIKCNGKVHKSKFLALYDYVRETK